MTSDRRSAGRPPRRRGRIRDAALVCIGRFGLAKTTVDDIAREAGCSRATLYRYFDGKPAHRPRRGRRASSTASPTRWSTPAAPQPTLRRRGGRRRRHGAARAARPRRAAVPARARARGGARPPRVRPRRPRARRGRRRHRARVRPLALGRRRARGRRLARPRRPLVRARCRTRRSTSPTRPPLARSSTQLVIPGLADKQGAHDLADPLPTSSAATTSTTSRRSSPITNTDVDEVDPRGRRDNADAIFTWDYERSRARARQALREGQDVAVERRRPTSTGRSRSTRRRSRSRTRRRRPSGFQTLVDARGHAVRARGARRSGVKFGIESQNWLLSQFMHGEQGALLCTAQIVETVPWIDAKYYAATQVMDEARHVEVFAKYLDTKLVGPLPDQRAPRRCCSTTSSPTAAGT